VTHVLYGLGRFCVRYRWPVLVTWVIIAAVLVAMAKHLGEDTNDNLKLPGTNSDKATSLLSDRFPTKANGSVPVVLHTKTGTLRDTKYAQAIDQTVKAYDARSDVYSAVSPLSPQGQNFLSKNGQTGYISLALKSSSSELTPDEANDLLDTADPAKNAGLEVQAGGYLGTKLSKPATESSELVGLACAVIVLLLTFGTAVAMGVPIITAILGLACGLSIITLLEHVTEVPSTAPTLATMLGLGVGIDYSLFLLSRHREQVRTGMAYPESIARAVATDGAAVVFAGTTVVIAICSLAVAGIPLVSVLGFASAIAVVTAVLAAITFVPALLALLGPRIESFRVPFRHSRGAGDPTKSVWYKLGRAVTHRPFVGIAVALAILIPLALPVLSLTLGQQDIGATSKSTTQRQAYDLIEDSFGVGVNGPLLVAVQLKSPATSPNDPRLVKLEQAVAKQSDVASVSPAALNGDGTVGIFNVISKSAPSDTSTSSLVKHIRSTVIPESLPASAGQAYVGGQTASYVDLASQISKKLPMLILIVIALSFIVLTIAFRSLVIPLEAAVMNLVSVAAAYGILTAIFEKGWGIGLVGLSGKVPVVSFVPLMMFAILFGLSMDYEVFLMNHIQEAYKRTHDNTEAVLIGLATSGGVITSAAAIMVSVFLSFVLNGDPTVKQFGVGLAAAVALDATIVRCILVPSLMTLGHDANWWFPRWLDRALPALNLEGQEFFAARDAAAARTAVGATSTSG
jgi:putative drug exporter of the RND superfamily